MWLRFGFFLFVPKAYRACVLPKRFLFAQRVGDDLLIEFLIYICAYSEYIAMSNLFRKLFIKLRCITHLFIQFIPTYTDSLASGSRDIG